MDQLIWILLGLLIILFTHDLFMHNVDCGTEFYSNQLGKYLKGSQDNLKGSHDNLKGSHDHLKGSHDHLKGSHDHLKGSHDHLKGSHDHLKGSHDHFKRLLDNKKKLKLFITMLALHQTFEENKIWYCIGFGTLLGAVRHSDLIDWDDDMDILVRRKDLKRITQALKSLEDMGYVVEKDWKLIKVYADKDEKLCIDLFITEEMEDGIVARCQTDEKDCNYLPKSENWWFGRWFGFPKKYIESRKKFNFGGLSLWGPVDAKQLLTQWYGEDFLTTCVTQEFDHHTKTYIVPKVKKCPPLPPPQF